MQLAMTPVLPVATIISDSQSKSSSPSEHTLAIVSEESQVPEDANPLSSINLARLLASCGDCV